MSDIRVKGFEDISFWREDEIGLIILRSSSSGKIKKHTLDELIMALSTASIDGSVESIAITGQNDFFATELLGWDNPIEMLDSMRALASIIYSIEKPIYAIVNGDAIDIGYELALLCDTIISAPEAKLGLTKQYMFAMGGSLTSAKFLKTDVKKALEGMNCDYVFPASDLLGESKILIGETSNFKMVLKRKSHMRFIREALGEEHLALLARISEIKLDDIKSKKIGV
ncbi:MAG: enoyl-CoA hydratase-related protein [Candidatus Thermoplasmatota archaeon]|jgi:hypothetical protein|nr:enoyl-CoA hydratase-related protein [Candidatus Thermoplasmatota archaeon]MCL5955396.1 enoyl-CoA hydratase-related protein [Candidatus Thermoplasmatota archaeon]